MMRRNIRIIVSLSGWMGWHLYYSPIEHSVTRREVNAALSIRRRTRNHSWPASQ